MVRARSWARSRVDLGVGGGHLGRGEVAEADRAVGPAHDAIEVDVGVGDASGAELAQLLPETLDGRVGQVDRSRRDRLAIGSHDQQGVAVAGAPGHDEPRGSHPGPLGEQGDEPLVLDELESAQPRRSLRAAVPHQPPHRGEQLGIPGIAAVDLDRQRPDIVGGGEQHDARAVHRHRLELAGIDAELAQCPFDAGVRRAATGRPDDEVHDRRRQQADRGRGDRPADRQRAEQHRADDRGADEPPAEVPERAGEVRRRHGDRRAGDGDGARRERGRTVEAHEPPRRAPGAAGDEHVQAERGEPSEGHPGRHRGEQHHAVTRRGDHDQRQRPPERRPDQGRPQRVEEVRQRFGQRHGGSADVARHRVQHAHQHDDEGGEDRQRDVGGTPGQRLVRARREQQQATGTPTRQWRGGHGGRSRRAGHRSGS